MAGGNEGVPPYYLEAELNSPLCSLDAGESCSMRTEWFPTRIGKEFTGVTDAGVITRAFAATHSPDNKVVLSGIFGVLFSGRLIAHFYDDHGLETKTLPVADVNPAQLVSLQQEVTSIGNAARVSLHLQDAQGVDRGSLGEVQIVAQDSLGK
jgi:hypothetical protein